MAGIPSKRIQDAALKLLKQSVRLKRGERIALVTDREGCMIFVALCAAAEQLGGDITEVYLSPNRMHSAPIPVAKNIFAKSDVIVAPTRISITHSPETYLARKNGARVVSMPDVTESMFLRAMEADNSKISKIHSKLMRSLAKVKQIRITSPSGTDFTIDAKGRKLVFQEDSGDISAKGTMSNIPFGEVYTYIGLGDGCLAIDSWGRHITKRECAKLWVKGGKIIKWNKGAEPYIKHQLKAGTCGFLVAELGIGTNPNIKRPIGDVLNDEKIGGSVHIAFGGAEGLRKCAVHEDFVLLSPTLDVGGKILIRRGKFV